MKKLGFIFTIIALTLTLGSMRSNVGAAPVQFDADQAILKAISRPNIKVLKPKKFTPDWSHSKRVQKQTNHTYFSDYDKKNPFRPWDMTKDLMNEADYRHYWEVIEKASIHRRLKGPFADTKPNLIKRPSIANIPLVNEPLGGPVYTDDLSQAIASTIIARQIDKGVKEAEKKSTSVRTFKDLQSQGNVVARPRINTVVGNKTNPVKFGADSNIMALAASGYMHSSYLNSSLQLSAGTTLFGLKTDPFTFQALNADPEKVRLSLWREVPLIKANSHLSYGFTKKVVKASLEKQLTNHLKASVISERGLEPGNGNGLGHGGKGEDVIRMDYGFNF